MKFKLELPFSGKYPITFPFGALPNNQHIKEKYGQWGLIGHNGIDFGLPPGTEVLATDSGRVVRSGENSDFGISIIIQHKWGMSLYAHLQQTKVEVGQIIKREELIGLSGSTGFAFGAHLHFGIMPINPDSGNGFHGYIDPNPFFQTGKLGLRSTRQFKKITRNSYK